MKLIIACKILTLRFLDFVKMSLLQSIKQLVIQMFHCIEIQFFMLFSNHIINKEKKSL